MKSKILKRWDWKVYNCKETNCFGSREWFSTLHQDEFSTIQFTFLYFIWKICFDISSRKNFSLNSVCHSTIFIFSKIYSNIKGMSKWLLLFEMEFTQGKFAYTATINQSIRTISIFRIQICDSKNRNSNSKSLGFIVGCELLL